MTELDASAVDASSWYLFAKAGRSFLFDTSTSSSYELDPGDAAARTVLGRDTQAVTADPGGEAAAQLTAALSETGTAEDHRAFPDQQAPRKRQDRPIQPAIRAIISRRCNLRCGYCYAAHDTAPIMSRPVMEATAEFIARYRSESTCLDRMPFGVVSEITSDLAQYDAFTQLLAQAGARHGISLPPRILLSNLTTMNSPEVSSRLEELLGEASASLDGPPEVHDALRVHPNGKGTYADTMRGVERLRSLGCNPGAQAVVTALYPDVSEIYFHLFGMGFPEVAVKPVRARPDRPHAIGRNLAEICAGYDRFASRLLALPDDELLRRLLAIGMAAERPGDYFARFLVRVMERHRLERRCPAWLELAAVDTDGQIYGCNSLLGVPEARVGSVWDGIDEARVQELTESTHVSRREPCRTCWARRLCGGGCIHQSYLTLGEFGPPDPDECTLNRHIIETAIWMTGELQRTRPAVLSALPRSARRQWRETPPVLCRRLSSSSSETPDPLASMQTVAPCDVILPATSLRKRLLSSSDRRSLEVRLAWDRSSFYLLLTPDEVASENLWTKIGNIYLVLHVPPELVDRERSRVPPRLHEFRWGLTSDLRGSPLRYDQVPRALSTAVPPGAVLDIGRHGCLIRLPWRDVDMAPPEVEAEFGLRVNVHDHDGGELAWRPDQEAVRVRLAS
jgi:uncharacterized protein